MLTLVVLFIVVEARRASRPGRSSARTASTTASRRTTGPRWSIIGAARRSSRSWSSARGERRAGRDHRTGRVAGDVRPAGPVFAHLQRLSLDYYTDEKAGVIMTRMTSDIETLQQLLQDGLAQFAMQGLTMVVVTVILFSYNVDARAASPSAHDRARSSPGCRCGSARRPTRGYNRVRDGIAGVLSDLSESLSGVRVVTGFNRQRHNVLHHRNVVGDYRDANDYTAARHRHLRPGHRVRRAARPGRPAAHRRQHGARRHALASASSSRSSST